MAAYLTDVKPRDVAPLIDHTNLMPTAREADIAKLCDEAREHGFASVCITPSRVVYAAKQLAGSSVAVCTVVGFPLGATDPASKAYEAKQAIHAGASEIDMVVNNGLLYDSILHDGSFGAYHADIVTVANAVSQSGGKVLKCIIETGYLSPQHVHRATEIVAEVAASYPSLRVYTKTSTGMAVDKLLVPKYDGKSANGARVGDLEIIAQVHATRPDLKLGIKASGGVRTFADVVLLLEAMGARTKADITPDRYRIGASASVQIVS